MVGGLGMKRIRSRCWTRTSGRPPVHIVLDAALVVVMVSLGLAGPDHASVVLLPPVEGLAGETGAALLHHCADDRGTGAARPVLAATRWRHRMRYDVVGRSIGEPYAAILAALPPGSLVSARSACWSATGRER